MTIRGLRRIPLAPILNGMASVQLVWYYLAFVRCYVDLDRYEAGTANTPYQYRLLLMLPLRWAHGSAICQTIAATLTGMHPWFPQGVRPEHLVEFPLDLASVAIAGLVTRRLYSAASPTGLLQPLLYPLTLLMIAVTYALGTMHRLRFVYDLPSLGFFAAGIFLLYFRRPRWMFALLFTIATINRETTLFLLLMFVLARSLHTHGSGRLCWRNLRLAASDGLFATALLSLWTVWHLGVAHHFAGNATESWSRLRLNLGILAVPLSWLQVLSCFAFCGPLLLVYRRTLQDNTLRLWMWTIPVWVLFMLRYGLIVESRIFGELIPLVACCVALGAEQSLLRRLDAVSGRRHLGSRELWVGTSGCGPSRCAVSL